MRRTAFSLILCLLLSFCACTQRSAVPTMAVQPTTKEPTRDMTEVSEKLQPQVDLSPLTESSLGQALVASVREVESVVITSTENGEVVYESTDDVLSQGFYDTLQIINEEYETLDIRPIDYEVDFTTALGIKKHYGLWINFTKDNNVIVQCDGDLWDLPIGESNWLRAKIGGLA